MQGFRVYFFLFLFSASGGLEALGFGGLGFGVPMAFGVLGLWGGLEAKGCIGHGIDFRKKLLGVGVGFRALGVSEVQRVFRVSFSEGLLKHPSTRKALINSCNTYRNTLEHPSNALLEPP